MARLEPGALWISPHLDDAALSGGGAIASAVQAGLRQRVLTACTRAPDPQTLSPLAAELHRRWGLAPGRVLAAREAEDRRALAVLGAEQRGLGLLDAVYRCPEHYRDLETLLGSPAPSDPLLNELRAALEPELRAWPQARIYAPLGVGGHVDHQQAFLLGLELAHAGREVRFYEDLPYVLRAGELERRMEGLGVTLVPELVDVSAAIAAKIAAIAAYQSQLSSLFGSAEAMPAAVSSYARAVGREVGLRYAERHFKLATSPSPGASR